MEVHYYKCNRCGKTTESLANMYTISRKYKQSCYDMIDGEYETTNKEEIYHICKECWNALKGLILSK